MLHMLCVTAGEIGDPMTKLVLVKINDRPRHTRIMHQP